jgi:amidase
MHFKSATELVAALQARQLSAVELTDATIARVKSHDAEVNAVVVRDFERAKVAAAQADAALARGDRRPLLGLPITVKEAFNVAGLPTTWGIPGTENVPVHHDAVAVSRLKNAGAIVIGKTNVPTQLADWQTFNPIYGTTTNPWNPARTPGGSSGGSAACLAAGFVSLELGTDLSGSLRVPAHCCGVFAHKPSYGLVPMRGCSPPGVPMLSISADIDLAVAGPMARSAADLALGLDVLAGPDDSQATAYSIALPAPRHARLAEFRGDVHLFADGIRRCRHARGDLRKFADCDEEAATERVNHGGGRTSRARLDPSGLGDCRSDADRHPASVAATVQGVGPCTLPRAAYVGVCSQPCRNGQPAH